MTDVWVRPSDLPPDMVVLHILCSREADVVLRRGVRVTAIRLQDSENGSHELVIATDEESAQRLLQPPPEEDPAVIHAETPQPPEPDQPQPEPQPEPGPEQPAE